MRVWLIAVGEPLPTDGTQERLLREGILAGLLADQGHDVVWWSSTFDHSRKQQRFDRDTTINLKERLQLRLLHGVGYRANVSARRLVNHFQVARAFSRAAAADGARPDIIHCAFPTIELGLAATAFGRKHGIPVVVDVRDLWPDTILDVFPAWGRPLAKMALAPYFRGTSRVFSRATAVTGMTQQMVSWALDYGGRSPAPLDRVFPHGYPDWHPEEKGVREAAENWRKMGVGAQEKNFVCCFFGNMAPFYELETIISAARLLQQETPEIQFVLCGSGDSLKSFRDLAQGLDNVWLPGRVGGKEIQGLMKISAVGLAPYRSTFGYRFILTNKVGEYLSGGLPVVTSLQGALGDLVTAEGCGELYPNENSEALKKVLLELHQNPDRRAGMASRARALFEKRFAAGIVYEQLANYLQEMCGVGTPTEANPCVSQP